MKIATWNVNSIRARHDRAVAWLERWQPDVVCLQETKVEDADFPVEALDALGYQAAAWGQRGYNGVAILSRLEPSQVSRGFGDGGDDEQARVIRADVGDVAVVCVYVPNGQEPGTDKYAYKMEWMERLRSYLDRSFSRDQPLILAGDFNVAPEDRDTYNAAIWRDRIMCTVGERERLANIEAFGLTDTLRAVTDEPEQFTWWDYRLSGFKKNRGLRIDIIYATESMAARLERVDIDRDERKGKLPSDHAPVIATFTD